VNGRQRLLKQLLLLLLLRLLLTQPLVWDDKAER
jgi:hypothetical protein